MKEVTLQELIDFKKNYCDNFFPKDLSTWSSVVLLECSKDKELMEEVKEYLSIKNENTSAEELDSLMKKLRRKSNKYLKEINDIKTKEEFYEKFTRGLVYYGILESLDELATFSVDLINAIKEKYKANYLEIISNYDRSNLSIDGAKVLSNSEIEEKYANDELLKKYKVLKIWQDKQHGYYQTVIEPILNKMYDYYEKKYHNDFDIHFDSPLMLKKYYELCNSNLLDIDELSKCYLCGMDKELIKLVGGKAYGLAVLNANNIPIPKTYVIPVNRGTNSLKELERLSKDIHYSVRSSADIEDGNTNSFAGMFDSYLNINYDELLKYIQKVDSSKNNNRVQKYIEMNNLNQPNMAVVIQQFLEPEYAGVWIGNDNNSGYLEFVKGNGEKLVSGKTTPEKEIWDKKTSKNGRLKSKEGYIGELLLKYQSIVAKDDKVADFEWMILDNHLIMLQYRPVTSKIKLNEIEDNTEKGTYKGIPASPGKVTAPARFINARYIDKVKDWHEGDILLAWFTDPEWMNILSNSSAIVTAVGGFLCHAAIIARELNIPCVIGIGGNNMKEIWEEEELTVDGDKGIVSKTLKKTKHI